MMENKRKFASQLCPQRNSNTRGLEGGSYLGELGVVLSLHQGTVVICWSKSTRKAGL